jgi:eukaryotic-like serine/threonine-protein kinase
MVDRSFTVPCQPQPLIQTPSNDAYPDLSPDGRWLAYASDDGGRSEVYVRPFPGPGGRQQISTSGGTAPAWGKNSRELFYMSPTDESGTIAMMAVDVSTGTPFKGMPKVLFKGRRVAHMQGLRGYDVTRDGQRFIMAQWVDAPPPQPVTEINLVLNWIDELKCNVPSGKK